MHDIIMSHIFGSHLTVRALEAIGDRRIILVDNSFSGELLPYCRKHSSHIHYYRPPHLMPSVAESHDGHGLFEWRPLSCAASWNAAMGLCATNWCINVNPDTFMGDFSLEVMDRAIRGLSHPDLVVLRTQLNFNIWAGNIARIRDLGGYDIRFHPCGGEDEDLLLRVSDAGLKWGIVQVPAHHMEGGHRNRVDGYRNVKTFVDKWGFRPHSEEYNKRVSRGQV